MWRAVGIALLGVATLSLAGTDSMEPPWPVDVGNDVNLLAELAQARRSPDYFGSARIYVYPDADGQTREDLVRCYRETHQYCGSNKTSPCDPDDDAHPERAIGFLPEDLAEVFLLPRGNVFEVNDPNIDFYVVNP